MSSCCRSKDDSLAKSTERIISVWEERHVFDATALSRLKVCRLVFKFVVYNHHPYCVLSPLKLTILLYPDNLVLQYYQTALTSGSEHSQRRTRSESDIKRVPPPEAKRVKLDKKARRRSSSIDEEPPPNSREPPEV